MVIAIAAATTEAAAKNTTATLHTERSAPGSASRIRAHLAGGAADVAHTRPA
jgi:hypothetical protein